MSKEKEDPGLPFIFVSALLQDSINNKIVSF